MMRCRYCNAPIKAFIDAMLETYRGEKRVRCADLDACAMRVSLNRDDLRRQGEDACAEQRRPPNPARCG
jgi:hypothetical protein